MIYYYSCKNKKCNKYNDEVCVSKPVSMYDREENCVKCNSKMNRIFSNVKVNGVNFEPFFDPVLRTRITSYTQQDKEMKRHRSPSHPEGLMRASDDRKFIQECKHIRRHREEWKEANRQGYKAGEGKYDADRPDRYRSGTRIFSYSK